MSDKFHVVKICGFGKAKILNLLNNPYASTAVYGAPELLLGSKDYSVKVDIWAVACIFIFMLTNNLPFEEKDNGD